MNAVAELQRSLQTQYDALSDRRATLPVDNTALDAAIRRQSLELLHRINLLEDAQLVAMTNELQAALGALQGADQQLTQDLQQVADATRLVESVTTYLGQVDATLGVLKRLATV